MPETAKKSRINLDYYHSATQFRFDSWHRLAEYADRLRIRHSRGEDVASLGKKTFRLLSVLHTLEDYTAFPSIDDFNLLWNIFNKQDYVTLARYVERIVRVLSNGSYRLRRIELSLNLDFQQEHDPEHLKYRKEISKDHQKPYFEVLFVDKNAHEEYTTLRDGLAEIARPEDDFVYNIVVVPSFEDALIAILFNYNIQACVIRYEFPLRSKNHLKVLQRYLSRIDESEYENMPDIGHGPMLGAMLAELRPELDLYLVTDESVESIAWQ